MALPTPTAQSHLITPIALRGQRVCLHTPINDPLLTGAKL